MDVLLSSDPLTLDKPYRRVAVFGGIYNNHLALQAALTDAQHKNVEAVFCLGDIGGFGPYPNRSVDLLREHDVYVMRGNYDESIAMGLGDCGCGYTDPRDNRFAQISYDYTLAHTSPENRAWLGKLPPSYRFRLGSTRVATCHGSPRGINEFLWESATPRGLIQRFLGELEADLLLCTHTGIKWQKRTSEKQGIVNVGALGRPENNGETNVWYALLTADDTEGWQTEFVPVQYDTAALAADMREEKLPEEFVETILTGWWTTCLEILPAKERVAGRL